MIHISTLYPVFYENKGNYLTDVKDAIFCLSKMYQWYILQNMILVIGGVKGGSGKTTVAINLAVMRSLAGFDVL